MDRYDRVFDAWFAQPAAARPALGTGPPGCRAWPADLGGRRRRRARPTDVRRCVGAVASATEVLRHRDVADLGPAERRRARPAAAAARRPAAARAAAPAAPARRGPVDARAHPARPAAQRRRARSAAAPPPRRRRAGWCCWWTCPARWRRTPTTCCGWRTGRCRRRRRPTEVFTVGHPADPRHGGAAASATADAALRPPARPCRTGPAAPGSATCCARSSTGTGQRGMARGAVVVVFSDGWERGDPALLAEQVQRLRAAGAPADVGQPAPRQGRLPAGRRAASSRCCPRSTSCSPGTRWRRSRSCWRWSPVRDVLTDLLQWWHDGRAGGGRHGGGYLASAPRPAGAAMLVGPDGTAVGSVSRRLCRGRGLRAGAGGRRRRHAGAAAVRGQRRRRVRGRADLRRRPRRVRRERVAARPSPSWARSPPTSAADRPVAVATVVDAP